MLGTLICNSWVEKLAYKSLAMPVIKYRITTYSPASSYKQNILSNIFHEIAYNLACITKQPGEWIYDMWRTLTFHTLESNSELITSKNFLQNLFKVVNVKLKPQRNVLKCVLPVIYTDYAERTRPCYAHIISIDSKWSRFSLIRNR